MKKVAFEPLLEGRETDVPGSQARVAQARGEQGWRAGACGGCRGASRETKSGVAWPEGVGHCRRCEFKSSLRVRAAVESLAEE